jgi:AcrR family transcriptional regulator
VNQVGISKEKIIQASIEILNRDGIDSLTTRELAKELGIKSASLYWHIKNMQDLYGLISEQLCSEMEISCDISKAKEYLYEMNTKYRAKLLEIRDSVEIMIRSVPNTPNRVKIIKDTMECLSELGIKDENRITAANLLNNYVLSFVADEIRVKFSPPEKVENLNSLFEAKVVGDFDQQFLYGLNVLFAGFETV